MPITSYADYRAAVDAPRRFLTSNKTTITVTAGAPYSLWLPQADSGTAPTTAAAPTATTVGAIPNLRVTGGTARLAAVNYAGVNHGTLMLCDRLSHQGGLSGIVTTAQTTNLPTAALTRYTDGVGVRAALEIYTTIGTTATTVATSYTNQAGTAGRTSPTVVFGGTGNNLSSRFVMLPWQQGDQGVRSVESVTVTATTGTAGAFGVTLFRPLAIFPVRPIGYNLTWDSIIGGGGNMPTIIDNACLFWVYLPNSTSSGELQAQLTIINS